MSLIRCNKREDWNEFVLRNGGGFLQSWEWGEFQAAAGHEVRRYELSDEGSEPTVRLAMYRQPLPFGQGWGFVPMGPVVEAGEDRIEKFKSVVTDLCGLIRQEGLVLARLESFVRTGEWLNDAGLSGLGLRCTRSISPSDTSVVDLSSEPDGLLQVMKPKTRYNIRLAERKGVTVRQADPSEAESYGRDIAAFQQLLSETAGRDGFRTHTADYYEQMLRSLAPAGEREMSVRLFLAEFDGQPLAGALVAGFGDTATYLHGASSSEQRELMAPHQLHWQIMLWARQAGYKKYDFWGVAPADAPANHPWSGITRFKLGFGGEQVSYVGTWEMPGRQPWYWAYRLAQKLRGR